MANHELFKDKKGKYWFRSDDLLRDVTGANHFFISRRIIYWKWFVIPIWGYKLKGNYDAGWSELWGTYVTENRYMGSYEVKQEATDALSVLAKIRDMEVIGF